MPQASIIIPVFNAWELTRACLKALAATTSGKDIEIILVDNASTDVTRLGAPVLGKNLFGDAFSYIRAERNLNYGPATNMGACRAAGDYLVLLNNDTEPLPGWYDGLLGDFSAFPDIAATAPLLLYPETRLLGHTVQHLGVHITPSRTVGHLYWGIPAAAPLARKRRFFQCITAACMAIPRRLFLQTGMFDERYVNGFEDVDLCARLTARGYRFTVNPDARVIHHESQSAGRHAHDAANSSIFMAGSQRYLAPDLHSHVGRDNLALTLSPWLLVCPAIKESLAARLDKLAATLSFAELKELLVEQPLWEKGWQALMEMPEAGPHLPALLRASFQMFKSPLSGLAACAVSQKSGNRREAVGWLSALEPFCYELEAYRRMAAAIGEQARAHGLDALAAQSGDWLLNADSFRNRLLLPYLREYTRLRKELMPENEPDQRAAARN